MTIGLNGLLAEVDLSMLLQFLLLLLIILLPMILFARHKTASNRRRYDLKMARLEKGVISTRSKPKGPKWTRSIYKGVFYGILSSFFGYLFIDNGDPPSGIFFAIFLALGGLFLTRGILQRADWIKRLALDSGVPFEKVFPIMPKRSLWVTNFAVGLPLLGFSYFVFWYRPFDTTTWDTIVLGLSVCIGGALTLRGLFLWWYLRRESKEDVKSKAAIETTAAQAAN